jgi:hypothetical protein
MVAMNSEKQASEEQNTHKVGEAKQPKKGLGKTRLEKLRAAVVMAAKKDAGRVVTCWKTEKTAGDGGGA